tara:strand:+ start:138 stop:1091 length:954 start_codon:yes stop_codon:yes gene_type:complete
MHFFKTLLLIFFLCFSFIAPYKAYFNHKPTLINQPLIIDDGLTINMAISKITQQNIFNKLYLKIFLTFNKIDTFMSGEYQVYKKPLKEIIQDMEVGNTITHKITINEGTNIYELNNLINDSYLTNDCEMLKCINTSFNYFEGILYPDTYFYKRGDKASKLLQKSHDRLTNYLYLISSNENRVNSLNNEELLILSSIIEKEAGNHYEKPLIAGVFIKRLNKNMRLQADPTIIYGLLPNFDGDIKKSNILDKNNKYNTYMINGLPPSPIAISSISSIDAAFGATPGEYLYFVADTSKSHHFSKTYDEHLEKIQELGLDK